MTANMEQDLEEQKLQRTAHSGSNNCASDIGLGRHNCCAVLGGRTNTRGKHFAIENIGTYQS